MSMNSLRFVVVLGPPSAASALLAGVVCHCTTAAEADALLDSETPDLVVIDGAVGWHLSVAERARQKGSAVVALGALPPGALADEWVRDPADPDLRARLELAVARARERRRVVRRSCTDALTGLSNRREVLRAAAQLAARAQRTGESLALVLLDLDRFKEVNDRLGHPAGDRVLRRVGLVLRREVRQGEVCGRIGGDEFALVLTGGFAEARAARDRVLAALSWAGVSASAGIAVSRGGRRLRHLYADADSALLTAKRGLPRDGAPSRVSTQRKEVQSNDHVNAA
jgi:diguanylate cyclase (GGDEF)-like protein